MHSHGAGGHSHTHSHHQFPDLFKNAGEIRAVPRLLKLVAPECSIIICGTLALLISAGINLALPYSIGLLIDSPDASIMVSGVTLIWVLCIVFVVGSFFTLLRGYLLSLAGERVVRRIRAQLFDAMLRQEIAFFDVNRTGDLTNRLSVDTMMIQQAATLTLGFLMRFSIQIIGGIVMLFTLSPELTLFMMIPMPIMICAGLIYGRLARRMQQKVQAQLGRTTETAEQTISGIRFVRAFGQEARESHEYGHEIDASFDLGKILALYSGIYQGGVEFLAYAAVLCVIGNGVYLLSQQKITPGELSSFLLYTIYVSHALGALAAHGGEFMRAVGASQRVFTIIDREPTMTNAGGLVPEAAKGEVRFSNVRFAYPTRPGVPIYRDLTFHVRAGEKVAVVGPSGAGKTTILSLLLRMYEFDKGSIMFDEYNVRELNPQWLRKQVALVPQEPILFACSVRDNIKFGNADASDIDVIEAAKLANAHEFISELPQHYDTLCGERGVALSGGQKQRIAIARAALMKPAVLLLDEPTSALDARAERAVTAGLEQVLRGRTALIVAHRLSTVKRADRIIVIQDGRICEDGTFDELAKAQGLFARLVRYQLEDNEDLTRSIDEAAVSSPSSASTSGSKEKIRKVRLRGRKTQRRIGLKLNNYDEADADDIDDDADADDVALMSSSPLLR